jgi:uncharacterized protein (TIGR02757 family)
MTRSELKAFLDVKAAQYQHPDFLKTDPIQIPHAFERKEDIEIAGFLTATIAWGNRKSIIRSAEQMMELMEQQPYAFTMGTTDSELDRFKGFVHRTFNAVDFAYFIKALRHLYKHHGGLEGVFTQFASTHSLQETISEVRQVFFAQAHPKRSEKHFSDPLKGSAAKRINMFLRWMVRESESGVDFGLWKGIEPGQLSCPLDVHSGKVARALGLLDRKQNDARAVVELDENLRKLDPEDPVKYDFALFGLGVFEGFANKD